MSKKTRKKLKEKVSAGHKRKAAAKKRSNASKSFPKGRSKTLPKKAARASRASGKSGGKSTKPAAATVLREGQAAPPFSLPRDGGQTVALANYTSRKLVIFFYPRADTPGCTKEAMDFSRLAKAFAASRTEVMGVSADPLPAQESFRDKHKLTVPLISDEKQSMLKSYGAWGEKSMYGRTFEGVLRTTVLVDPSGKIARIWRNVRVDGHADEVLAAARAL